MIPYEIAAILAVVAGCALRSVVPFLKKQLAAAKLQQEFKWKRQYTITIILSLVLSVPTALFILSTWAIPETGGVVVGFMTGYTASDITNRAAT